jgi:hypothetical protein
LKSENSIAKCKSLTPAQSSVYKPTPPFLLHWTNDDWQDATDTPSKTMAVRIDYADIVVPNSAVSMQFTFFWVDEDLWEGEDYNIQVRATAQMRRRVAV